MVDYSTHRYDEEWRWELLDKDDQILGMLDGVRTGSVKRNWDATIQTGGSMEWTGRRADIPDWLNVRIRPVYLAKFFGGGSVRWPMGTFIPAAPKTTWNGTLASISVQLFDKNLIIDRAKTTQSYSIAAGTNVTTKVVYLLNLLAQTKVTVNESSAVTKKAMAWKPGTKWLTVINDLLHSINYLPLHCDNKGYYRVVPHILTSSRGVTYPFSDGPDAIYAPEFDYNDDYFDLPNRVTLVSQGTGGEEGITAVATLPSTDPLSYAQRGEWIDVTETGVEADSQATLNELAKRRIETLTNRAHEVDFNHALIPLDLNDVVTFKRSATGVNVRGLVRSMTIPCQSGRLVSTIVRQVIY